MRLRDLVRDRAAWIFAALVVAMFYRPLTTETFYFRDLYRLFYPKRVFFAGALRSGVFPLWDPLTNGGQPFLAEPANFALHPSNVLYLLLPTIVAFNLVLVLHVLFCALAAYWLARTLALRAPAAFVCGAVFAFCGYTLSAANLTPLLLGLPWVPLTIGLLHRAQRDRRSILPAVIAAAMPLYGAASELTAMLFVTIVVWLAAVKLPVSALRKVFVGALVIAGAIGLSLPQTLPATSVIAQSARSQKRSFASFAENSVHPLRLAELAVPRFLGDLDSMVESDRWGRMLESGGYPYILSLYFGVPALLLAGIGAVSRRSSEVPRRALAALGFTGILFSLGRHLPWFDVLYAHLPFVGMFRFPVKAQVLALLPIALLAACGAERVIESIRARRAMRIAAIGFAVLFAVAAILLVKSEAFAIALANTLSFTTLAPHHRVLLGASLLHAAIAALAIAAASARSRLIAAVVALDLVIAGFGVNDFAPRSLFSEPPLAAQVRALVHDGRFHSAERPLVVRAPGNDMMWLARWQLGTLADYNAAAYGIATIYHEDYDDLAPLQIARLTALMPKLPWPMRKQLLDRSDVRAFLTPDVVSLPGIREVQRIEAAGLHLYANDALPPARFVSTVAFARNDGEAALHMLKSNDASTAIVEGAQPRAERCGNAPVRIVERLNHATRYEVDAPCAGIVVFADHPYAGWSAAVDGASTPILRVDYAFTAVAAPRGRHIITRTYFPPRLREGVLGMLLTSVALVVIARRLRGSAARG